MDRAFLACKQRGWEPPDTKGSQLEARGKELIMSKSSTVYLALPPSHFIVIQALPTKIQSNRETKDLK